MAKYNSVCPKCNTNKLVSRKEYAGKLCRDCSHSKYTPQELEFLKTNAPLNGFVWCAEQLNRPYDGIKRICSKHKIQSGTSSKENLFSSNQFRHLEGTEICSCVGCGKIHLKWKSQFLAYNKQYCSKRCLSSYLSKTHTQENAVKENLESFLSIQCQKQYPAPDDDLMSDYYEDSIGHIEYDGRGFWHVFRRSDTRKVKYAPVRLNAQAYFGGVPYLKWKILHQKEGYCSVVSPKEYIVKEINYRQASDMLQHCHPLGKCSGHKKYGLYYQDHLIGVSVWGQPTNKNEVGVELRRFFVLDGTPRNTESWFLNQCVVALGANRYISYCHSHEKGSYLKACGWKATASNNVKHKEYDIYIVNGREYSKRIIWYWAKKLGLVDECGSLVGKKIIAEKLGAEIHYEPTKIKFIKEYK